ncbi:MAG: alpha/beta family hydrolase, partial [Myxococcota bacterium]
MRIRKLTFKIQVPGHPSVSAAVHVRDAWRPGAGAKLLLGHGAGNDMHNPLLAGVCERLAAAGHLAMRMNFPYKEQGRKPPDRAPVLMAALQAGADRLREDRRWAGGRLFLGGKSLGGRMASMIAAAGYSCDGLIFLGYPLHPAGRREATRDAHFPDIRVPCLFLQGSRDPLCDLRLLRPRLRRIGAPAAVYVVREGDHSFKVPKRAGRT